jgi:hypothetical protein
VGNEKSISVIEIPKSSHQYSSKTCLLRPLEHPIAHFWRRWDLDFTYKRGYECYLSYIRDIMELNFSPKRDISCLAVDLTSNLQMDFHDSNNY